MKCIVIFVGLLAILALAQAEDEVVQEPSSEQDSEQPAPPAEDPQADESEHPHHHHPHHHHEHEGPAGKPPKRDNVFKIGIDFDTGK